MTFEEFRDNINNFVSNVDEKRIDDLRTVFELYHLDSLAHNSVFLPDAYNIFGEKLDGTIYAWFLENRQSEEVQQELVDFWEHYSDYILKH